MTWVDLSTQMTYSVTKDQDTWHIKFFTFISKYPHSYPIKFSWYISLEVFSLSKYCMCLERVCLLMKVTCMDNSFVWPNSTDKNLEAVAEFICWPAEWLDTVHKLMDSWHRPHIHLFLVSFSVPYWWFFWQHSTQHQLCISGLAGTGLMLA